MKYQEKLYAGWLYTTKLMAVFFLFLLTACGGGGDKNDGPLVTNNIAQQAYLKASNAGSEDEFGASVALDGDTLVVAASREDGDDDSLDNSGAVYVFIRNSDGGWDQQAVLTASNGQNFDRFGISVALHDDTLAVGAFGEDGDANSTIDNSNNNTNHAGAVYVFTRDDKGEWSEQAYLKASNPGEDDFFGESLALFGDTLAVGVRREDGDAKSTAETPNDKAQNAGAVYIFTRNSEGKWKQRQYLKASDASTKDEFGASVALSGDTLAVGAPRKEGRFSNNLELPGVLIEGIGAAYVFTRDDAGDWSEQAALTASNTGGSDEFGASVALSGDTLAVGAHLEDGDATSTASNSNENAEDAGAVYVFTRDDEGKWSEQAYIKASDASGSDEFGASVALSGDALVVGAPFALGTISTNSVAEISTVAPAAVSEFVGKTGAAFVFTQDDAGDWSERARLTASNTGASDEFGGSVALSGDTLAVGAHMENGDADSTVASPNDKANNSGAVYVFR
ncbi:MAG: FG-GAP repeat protein [Gammaproteobacteria bacterium]|nr:FG-GAP repeat protein [Gammaproteobacteria bacterium]